MCWNCSVCVKSMKLGRPIQFCVLIILRFGATSGNALMTSLWRHNYKKNYWRSKHSQSQDWLSFVSKSSYTHAKVTTRGLNDNQILGNAIIEPADDVVALFILSSDQFRNDKNSRTFTCNNNWFKCTLSLSWLSSQKHAKRTEIRRWRRIFLMKECIVIMSST